MRIQIIKHFYHPNSRNSYFPSNHIYEGLHKLPVELREYVNKKHSAFKVWEDDIILAEKETKPSTEVVVKERHDVKANEVKPTVLEQFYDANTATVEELVTIKGIGSKRASDIIDKRPYINQEDLDTRVEVPPGKKSWKEFNLVVN